MTASSIQKPVKRSNPGMVAFQAGLVLALVVVIWLSWKSNLPPLPGAPHRLGDLERTHEVRGKEALDQIERLHGTEISLVEGYVAHYAKGSQTAEVWVGIAESKEAAVTLVQRMTEAIREGNSPFTNPREITVEQRQLFTVQGQGGSHYYYSSEDKVVWLTINASDPLLIVAQALGLF